MSDTPKRRVITLDSRKRVSLGRIATVDADMYIVTAEPSGRIIMEPVKTVPIDSDEEDDS